LVKLRRNKLTTESTRGFLVQTIENQFVFENFTIQEKILHRFIHRVRARKFRLHAQNYPQGGLQLKMTETAPV